MLLPSAALGPERNATSLGNDRSSGGNRACLLTSSLLAGLGTRRPQRKGQRQRQLQKKTLAVTKYLYPLKCSLDPRGGDRGAGQGMGTGARPPRGTRAITNPRGLSLSTCKMVRLMPGGGAEGERGVGLWVWKHLAKALLNSGVWGVLATRGVTVTTSGLEFSSLALATAMHAAPQRTERAGAGPGDTRSRCFSEASQTPRPRGLGT